MKDHGPATEQEIILRASRRRGGACTAPNGMQSYLGNLRNMPARTKAPSGAKKELSSDDLEKQGEERERL
jgi:hypothetical protein